VFKKAGIISFINALGSTYSFTSGPVIKDQERWIFPVSLTIVVTGLAFWMGPYHLLSSSVVLICPGSSLKKSFPLATGDLNC